MGVLVLDTIAGFPDRRCSDALHSFRAHLSDAGYTEENLGGVVKNSRGDICLLVRRIAEPTRQNVLTRLFFLGEAVNLDAARNALAPVDLEALADVGLVKLVDQTLVSQAMALWAQGFLILSDFPPGTPGRTLTADHVLGVGASSMALASLSVRRRGQKVLDLCAGSGIQAMLASRHAGQVTATDLNRRALRYAAMNLALNEVPNVELMQGNLFEPVSGQKFDLFVSNPPFVVSPELVYLYRDSGWPGDSMSETVVRGAPDMLEQGGWATMLCNWSHSAEEDWDNKPRRWVSGSGCDAWILHFGAEDPLSYAARWLRSTEGQDQKHYSRALDLWVEHYRRNQVAAISSGVVILRRRAGGENWIRTDPFYHDRSGDCGKQIERVFENEHLLNQIGSDREMLDHYLVLASDHQLVCILKAREGRWAVQSSLLKQTEGLEFTGEVDRNVMSILEKCDGQHTLGELLRNLPAGNHGDFDAVAEAGIGVVKRLMQSGFLSASRTPLSERGIDGG